MADRNLPAVHFIRTRDRLSVDLDTDFVRHIRLLVLTGSGAIRQPLTHTDYLGRIPPSARGWRRVSFVQFFATRVS